MRPLSFSALVLGFALASAGCTFAQLPNATPTLIPATETATSSPVPSQAPTATRTPTAAPTDTAEAIIAASDTPLPPSATPTPTETPGPAEHTIQSGETLGYIVQLYGHRSFDVFDAVVRINDNIPNADALPGPGNVILIPRPTATATPTGQAIAEAPAVGNANPPSVSQQAGGLLQTAHIVQEGESLVDIAQQYNTTLEIISQLNPDIGFFGCDFNIPSGGPDCIIILQVGQEVTVPAPTPTPTLSPTPSGLETATPTPTYTAPITVFPPNQGIAAPGIFSLQWVSTGILDPDEVYLVYIKDVTADSSVNAFTTRSTAFELPSELIPRSGQTHEFQWWVTVGRRNAEGFFEDISGDAPINTFFWQSSP